jgi:addiction module HigA family antidote
VSISNNTTEGLRPPAGEAPMPGNQQEHKAGPRRRPPTHPGRIIASALEALDLTPYAAAPLLGVTKQALGNVIGEKSAVSPDMALRLGKFFGNGAELWMGLQVDHDLWKSREKLKADLVRIKTVHPKPDA